MARHRSLAAFLLAALPVQAVERDPIQAQGWSFDGQGSAVASDGERLLVGASYGRSYAVDGSAHLFERDMAAPSGWREGQRLEAPGYGRVDRFGDALDIEGDVIAVGAPMEDDARGAVYVFERPAGGAPYELVTRLEAPLSRGGQRFGAELALDGGRLLVGAPRSSPIGGFWDGRALLYAPDPATGAWVQVDELIRPVTTPGRRVSFFGHAVALAGDVAVVATSSVGWTLWNEVHVFVHGSGEWEHRQVITSLDVQGNPAYSLIGDSLALEGGELVLADTAAGTVHFFRRSPEGVVPFRWVNSLELTEWTDDWLRSTVTIRGDRAAVGITASPWSRRSGTVELFHRTSAPDGTWRAGPLVGGTRLTTTSAFFGSSVLPVADQILVGDPGLFGLAQPGLGGVRVFQPARVVVRADEPDQFR